jgi:hypothetical protein
LDVASGLPLVRREMSEGTEVRSVRFLTLDVAIMHAVGGTIMPDQTDIEPERNSVQTLIAKKDDKG